MKELYILKVKDTAVFLQKPGSQATRKMGTVYSVAFSNALKMGIMSEIDIRNHIHQDKEERESLIKQWRELENKREMMLVKGRNPEKIDAKLGELAKKIDELNLIINKGIVENSAEVVAYQRVIDWMVTNLTFWEDTKLPLFSGATDDEKMQQFFDALDNDELVAKIIGRAIIIFQGYLMQGLTDTAIYDKVVNELDAEEEAG